MANPVGRPMKYKNFILLLEDDEVYTPAAIVNHGKCSGLTDQETSDAKKKKARLRIRHTMARFAANHEFPSMGDGLVKLKGQSATPGWFGWRWKDALPDR